MFKRNRKKQNEENHLFIKGRNILKFLFNLT